MCYLQVEDEQEEEEGLKEVQNTGVEKKEDEYERDSSDEEVRWFYFLSFMGGRGSL